jgi:hypothetical protein
MSNKDITNPGLVNVADEADGEIRINQTIETGPSYNPGPTVSVITETPIGHGLPSNNTAANSPSSR